MRAMPDALDVSDMTMFCELLQQMALASQIANVTRALDEGYGFVTLDTNAYNFFIELEVKGPTSDLLTTRV